MPKLKNWVDFGDLVGGQRRARDLDHGAVEVLDLVDAVLCADLGVDLLGQLELVVELFLGTGHRDHDLGEARLALLAELGGRLENGPELHLGDLGEGDAEADAAVTHHGVELVQLVGAAVEHLRRDIEGLGELLALGLVLGHELVQRRVEQAEGHGPLAHDLEGRLHVTFDEGIELVEDLAALGSRSRP